MQCFNILEAKKKPHNVRPLLKLRKDCGYERCKEINMFYFCNEQIDD